MKARFYTPSDKQAWDSYVLNHPHSTHCHLSGWKRVIENAYGHRGYYLLAEENSKISGILPLVHIKSFIFGNKLISMPFLNYGGILADNEETEIALLSEAIKLSQELRVNDMELRHIQPMSCLNCIKPINLSREMRPAPWQCGNYSMGSLFHQDPINSLTYSTRTHKARMLLELPSSAQELFKSFKSKLRGQISRPRKEGMTAVIGGKDLLDSFYEVFSINMRDLGSPVHSKKLFEQICNEFPQNIKINLVNYQNIAVAAGLVFCFRDTVEIPWASSLKKFNKFSPNMLLYWSLIEYACDGEFKYFDFGRSTPDEGTYKFKEQWGAKPASLYWHKIASDGQPVNNNQSEKSKFGKAIRYWKKVPVPVANVIGPLIRKNIVL